MGKLTKGKYSVKQKKGVEKTYSHRPLEYLLEIKNA